MKGVRRRSYCHNFAITKTLALLALIATMFTTYNYYQVQKNTFVKDVFVISSMNYTSVFDFPQKSSLKNTTSSIKDMQKYQYEECIKNLTESKTCYHTPAPQISQEPSETCPDTRCSLSACDIRVLGYGASSTEKHVRLTINDVLVFSIAGLPGIYVTLLAETCLFLEVHRFSNTNGTDLLHYFASASPGDTVVLISAGGYLHEPNVQTAISKHLGVKVKDGLKSEGTLSLIGRIGYPTFTEAVWESSETLDVNQTFQYDIGKEMPQHEKSKSWDKMASLHTKVELGGTYRPSDCIPKYTVAIIIPFRDREEHLKIFINHIIPFLIAQMIAFTIFVVEQDRPQVFNHATMMNIGYLEASNLSSFDCYIFHDVDLLPLDLCNSYYCSDKPRHLGGAVDKFGFKPDYTNCFGGAIMLNTEHITKINGFSNRFFGWGGEDDEIYSRLVIANLGFIRQPNIIGRYHMIKHGADPGNPRSEVSAKMSYDNAVSLAEDGLSSVSYNLTNITRHQLYTHIHARISGPTNREELQTYMKKWTENRM